jgi:short-subunit dehydrogenase
MKILLTGSSSGIGKSLKNILQADHTVIAPSRSELDLSLLKSVHSVDIECDILINCAGTGIGGKRPFVDHSTADIIDIFNVNLIAPVLLSQCVLRKNSQCKIVNITSTNNNHYWPNDLVYSLTKKSLADFGNMLKIDHPDCRLLEVRVGLTKTNFNSARYHNDPERYQDIYVNPHLTSDTVANKIVDIMFDDRVKYIEISP